MAAAYHHTEMEEKLSALNISLVYKIDSDHKNNYETTKQNFSQTDGKGKDKVNEPEIQFSVMSQLDDECYNMNHKFRGHCVILKERECSRHLCFQSRTGFDEDRDNVYYLFDSLGFEVKVEKYVMYNGIEKILNRYAYNIDHSDHDCFVAVILSHGKSSLFFKKNKRFESSEHLFDQFSGDNCPTLAGKPKMFFIEAHRGNQVDAGYEMSNEASKDEIDGVAETKYEYKIPNHVDYLVCWSTVPSYISGRDKDYGSWFIQSLVSIFRRYANRMDVLSMMTIVNRYLIKNFECCHQSKNKMKQCCSTLSTLMRLVYLKPKCEVPPLCSPVLLP